MRTFNLKGLVFTTHSDWGDFSYYLKETDRKQLKLDYIITRLTGEYCFCIGEGGRYYLKLNNKKYTIIKSKNSPDGDIE